MRIIHAHQATNLRLNFSARKIIWHITKYMSHIKELSAELTICHIIKWMSHIKENSTHSWMSDISLLMWHLLFLFFDRKVELFFNPDVHGFFRILGQWEYYYLFQLWSVDTTQFLSALNDRDSLLQGGWITVPLKTAPFPRQKFMGMEILVF